MAGRASERGFILTPTYRLRGGRPEVHLYAVLESGPGLIVDDRASPYFFVPLAAADRVRELVPAASVEPAGLASLGGEPVARVALGIPGDTPQARARLEAEGIACFEADVRFAYRYLMDRAVRGAFEVSGQWEPGGRVGRIYRNPALRPARWVPKLKVLAIDIETSAAGDALYSIALAGAGIERVLIVSDRHLEGAESFAGERQLLGRFLALVRELDPDVITGWNVVGFDLAFLLRRCRRAGLRCALGRTEDELDIRREATFTREPRAVVCGRQVLDALALVRGAFIRLDDYRLETAAQVLVGKGKLFGPVGREAAIEEAFRHDPQRLVDYNLEDARLVLEILARTGLVELAVERSLLTGMQLDRVGAAIASVDALYLPALRERGRVAPSVGSADAAPIVGGLVLEPRPGLYENVLVLDFKSLYPSLIRTFNLDPLTLVPEGAPLADEDVVRMPNGAAFRRQPPGILPDLVARLATERERAKREGRKVAAHALKILMNSLFGVLGSPACRFFSPAIANAITTAGQYVIRRAAEAAAALGTEVIYGDTDSLFIHLGPGEPEQALARGEQARAAIAAAVAAGIRRDFGCESTLELELEKLYRRFLLPEVRSGQGGSKKRYAGFAVGPGGGEQLECVGLEAVRRDASEVCRRFQRELLDLVFHDRPVRDYVRTFVADLRAGRYDDLLAYRKAVRKPLAAYTKTTPPHVRAARRAGGTEGRVVAYVITANGPEPVGHTTAPPDYQHYIDRQLRPVADSILGFLGTSFDELAGARHQLRLF